MTLMPVPLTGANNANNREGDFIHENVRLQNLGPVTEVLGQVSKVDRFSGIELC